MSEELKVIQDKVEEVATNVDKFQNALEKNQDTNSASMTALTDQITTGMEEVNAMKEATEAQKVAIESQKTDISNILKQINRLPGAETNDENQEVRKDFVKYLRSGVELTDASKTEIVNYIAKATYKDSDAGWVDAKALEMKSLMVGNDPNGGIFVRPQFSNRILTKTFETSPIRGLATVEPIGSESIEYVIDDEEFSSGGWVDEVEDRPDTDNGKVGKLTIHTHEQYAQPKATQKMLDDTSFNVDDWLIRKVSAKLGRVENTAFVVGDGAGKPKGLLSYAAWAVNGTYERGKVEQINTGIAGGFDGDDFILHQNALKEIYQPNANWLMKRASFGRVMTLKSGQGAYLINPAIIATGTGKTLLGAPVTFADDMPAIAADALSVAYGDFREGYTIADRIGMRVLRDPYTNKPFIRFYVTKRVGGAVTNYESFKIMKLAV